MVCCRHDLNGDVRYASSPYTLHTFGLSMFSLRADGGDADAISYCDHPDPTYDYNVFAVTAAHVACHGDAGAFPYGGCAASTHSDRYAAGYRNTDAGSRLAQAIYRDRGDGARYTLGH